MGGGDAWEGSPETSPSSKLADNSSALRHMSSSADTKGGTVGKLLANFSALRHLGGAREPEYKFQDSPSNHMIISNPQRMAGGGDVAVAVVEAPVTPELRMASCSATRPRRRTCWRSSHRRRRIVIFSKY